MKTLRPVFLISGFLFILPLLPLKAQEASTILPNYDSLNTLFKTIYSEDLDILEVTITTNMKQWIRKKYIEEYQPAIIAYVNQQGTPVNTDIKIRPRGNARKRICYYPPLKLKFKKSSLEAQGFYKDFNDLKLVNQCKNAKNCLQYVYQEYLAYKLYNIISPYSFRVQLIKINYVDSEGRMDPIVLYGFLIEDVEEMALRNKGKVIRYKKSSPTHLQKEIYDQFSAFQFMIGNTDWAVQNLHNIKLIAVKGYSKILPVGYDFDYAGLVNTYYAVPHESLSIKDVTERLYRGRACSIEESQAVAMHFLEKKEEIMELIEAFPHCDKRAKEYVQAYVEEFYKILEDSKRIRRILVGK